MELDILARQSYYIDHLAPIWNALPDEMRGTFYVLDTKWESLKKLDYSHKIQLYVDDQFCGHNPILTAAYGDAIRAVDFDNRRPVILMEHGIGLTFGKATYADGIGQRDRLSAFLMPNRVTAGKIAPELQHIPHPIIGVPKLDGWKDRFIPSQQITHMPTVAIAFHHGDKQSRPGVVGSAWEHYAEILPLLAERYQMIGHGHPLSKSPLASLYKQAGIPIVEDFEEVMNKADIYINDASSTAYEFLLTGKPVILLNAPWFDRKTNYGIRFWEYANVGLSVDDPGVLIQMIDKTIANPAGLLQYRQKAVRDLFPNLGNATETAVQEISAIMGVRIPKVSREVRKDSMPKIEPLRRRKVEINKSMNNGVIYMCFGAAAARGATRSILSLRATGSDLPVAVVGDDESLEMLEPIADDICERIPWKGESPYDASQLSRFQFRAGRVKPHLYELSPFNNTMYVDADVEFMVHPHNGMNFLKNWDFVIAQERLKVNELYNRPRTGWEHNLMERDETIKMFGGDGNFHFWNSGVFFFRKNKTVKELFALWSEEWERWEQWDEQLSLMRAANRSTARVFVLAETWNHPHKNQTNIIVPGASIIYHEYGRASVRSDAKE